MILRGIRFLRSYYSAPHPPPLPSATCLSSSVFLCVAVELPLRWEGLGVEPNHIRLQESLALYKSFNALCVHLMARRLYCASSFVSFIFPSSVLYRNKVWVSSLLLSSCFTSMCLNRFARTHSHHLGPLPEVSQTIQFRPAGNDRLELKGYANEISKLPFLPLGGWFSCFCHKYSRCICRF